MDTEKLLPLEVEIVMPFPSVMVRPSAVQKAAGEFIRPLVVLDTVQVRLYISPALLTPDLPILAVIALKGTGRFKVYHNQGVSQSIRLQSLTINNHNKSLLCLFSILSADSTCVRLVVDAVIYQRKH